MIDLAALPVVLGLPKDAFEACIRVLLLQKPMCRRLDVRFRAIPLPHYRLGLWSWKVGGNTTLGAWPVNITCGSQSVSTSARLFTCEEFEYAPQSARIAYEGHCQVCDTAFTGPKNKKWCSDRCRMRIKRQIDRERRQRQARNAKVLSTPTTPPRRTNSAARAMEN